MLFEYANFQNSSEFQLNKYSYGFPVKFMSDSKKNSRETHI